MPTIDELLERNKKVAQTHKPHPKLGAGLAKPSVIVVTCCDSRSNPAQIMDLEVGDAVLLRTAGGRVLPVMNDIIALDVFIGIKELMIVHHTDCGGKKFTDESIREGLRKRLPGVDAIERETFGAFTDDKTSVRDDIAAVRASPLMRKELADNTRGYIYDIDTGLIEPVDA